MPGERTRIALTPLPLALLCATEGIVCVCVAFLTTSYAHWQGINSCQGHNSDVFAVVTDLKGHIYN